MRTVTRQQSITLEDLRAMAARTFGDMVKAVVDIDRGLMIVDAEMHADEQAELIEAGSFQENLWGINLYPDLPEPDWLEYDSMINLRPSFGNRTRGVDDPDVRERIAALVKELVVR